MEKEKLGDYTKIKTGKLDANASIENGLYPFFTCSNHILRINNYEYDCECVLVAGNGDLNVKYYNGKFNAYQRTYIIESENKNILNTKYMYYLIDSKIEQLRKNSIGGVIKYIKLNNLTDLVFEKIKLDEQIAIVKRLDTVKQIIIERKKQINLLDELINSKFIEMFGTITFPKFIKRKLKDISIVKTGNTPSRKIKEYYGDCIEWIKSDNINNDNTYLTKAIEYLSEKGKEKGRVAPINSILVTCIAGSISCIGNAGINNREVCFNQQINAIIPKDGLNYLFMYYQIINNKEYLQSFVNKSMKGMLSKGRMEEIEFIFPSLEMQNKFVKIVEIVENQKQEYQRNLEKAQELMDTLMNKYFN